MRLRERRFYGKLPEKNYRTDPMISYLEGRVAAKTEKYAIIVVGGIGYKVFMPASDIRKIQQDDECVKIHAHLCVKEDALDLYGFLDKTQLELFGLFITISGIGPKVALTVLSTEKPSVLAGAIVREDITFLTKISGIGEKIAKKIVLELREKMSNLSFAVDDAGGALDGDAIDALVSLGWNVKDARDALKCVSQDVTRTEARITEALKLLGK